MDLFSTLKEHADTPLNNSGFTGFFEKVKHSMVSEPLLAHLCALNEHPRLIPKFFRKHGVNEESLLFFKWQLSCFHAELPKPCLLSYPMIFFERNDPLAYWHWLRAVIVTIVRSAPPCSDPRFNPLAIYWGARYIDTLTTPKTVKLVF